VVDAEEEDKDASSCPASVTHCAVIGDVKTTARLVETQTDWELLLSGQFQKDQTAPQSTVGHQQSAVVDVGDQHQARQSVHGNVTRHVHCLATVTDQVLQLHHVQDALAAGVVDRGGSKAVQCNGGRRLTVVVDVEGAQSVDGVWTVTVADDKVPARQPVGVQWVKHVVGQADVTQRITLRRVLDDQRALNERHQDAVVDAD